MPDESLGLKSIDLDSMIDELDNDEAILGMIVNLEAVVLNNYKNIVALQAMFPIIDQTFKDLTDKINSLIHKVDDLADEHEGSYDEPIYEYEPDRFKEALENAKSEALATDGALQGMYSMLSSHRKVLGLK